MQVGIFQESIVKKTCRLEKFQKLINVQDVIRPCRLNFFKKIIKRAACLLDRPEYTVQMISLRVLLVKWPDISTPTFLAQYLFGCIIKSNYLGDVPKAKS